MSKTMKRNTNSQEEIDNMQNETHADEKKKPKKENKPSETKKDIPGPAGDSNESEQIMSTNWSNSKFNIQDLHGHEGTVCCVAMDEEVILSGSEDTTIKVWNSMTCEEMYSLRGHASIITGILLLSSEASKSLADALSIKTTKIAITASLDCHLKAWCIIRGKEVKSLYTFNGINCIDYVADHQLTLTGTEGGKIEVYNLVTEQQVSSVFAYKEAVTVLKIFDNQVYTGSLNGTLKVWKFGGTSNLELILSSKQMKPKLKKHFGFGPIVSLFMHNNKLYVADGQSNITGLAWQEGSGYAFKFPNDIADVGITESMCEVDDFLLSVTSLGSINMRELNTGVYLCSVISKDAGQIFCIAAIKTGSRFQIVTGGEKLKVWNMLQHNESVENDPDVICTTYLPRLSRQWSKTELEVKEQNNESSDSDSESSENGEIHENPKGWWCTLL